MGDTYLLLRYRIQHEYQMIPVCTEASEQWIVDMNKLGKTGTPFLFILDFELQKPIIIPLKEIGTNIKYKFNHIQNYIDKQISFKPLTFSPCPIPFVLYANAFEEVRKEIQHGNSFLLNLTFPTNIKTNYNLNEIFNVADARYKLFFNNEFIVFSPEIFVQIRNGKIYTYPMKGTIDASIPNASEIILNDKKESAEHYTIVDLLRNDLSIVANQVKVNSFRYIESIKTSRKTLLQVSSEIEGQLPEDYQEHLGDIFKKLLPAGSISGAPKKKTVEIIQSYELDKRGYYTGVFGIFDGKNIDSAVMIRFIEQKDGQMIYRSGCGITSMSNCEAEYQEMIDKVYVPVC